MRAIEFPFESNWFCTSETLTDINTAVYLSCAFFLSLCSFCKSMNIINETCQQLTTSIHEIEFITYSWCVRLLRWIAYNQHISFSTVKLLLIRAYDSQYSCTEAQYWMSAAVHATTEQKKKWSRETSCVAVNRASFNCSIFYDTRSCQCVAPTLEFWLHCFFIHMEMTAMRNLAKWKWDN